MAGGHKSGERDGIDPREAAAFVLAGGMSSRMGKDKALVTLGGRPMITYAIATLRELGLSVSIAGARSELSEFGPVIEDAASGLGPLAGVCAALESTQARWLVFVSVDQSFVPGSLFACLLRRAQESSAAATLCSVNGFAQTFPAVIDRAALPALRSELNAGRSGCFAAFKVAAAGLGRPAAVVPAEALAQCGQAWDVRGLPAAFWFLNMNTPAELARAEHLLRRSIA